MFKQLVLLVAVVATIQAAIPNLGGISKSYKFCKNS